jgi:hypothetical protein
MKVGRKGFLFYHFAIKSVEFRFFRSYSVFRLGGSWSLARFAQT